MNNLPEYALILAAGKGSRMGSSTTHKVCFPVDGTPAILRALDVYRECGIRQNLVVVGTLAEQVIDTVGKAFPNTVFAYQPDANGTAGAIRAALNATPSMREDADIFIAAGDRLLEVSVVEQLFDLYNRERCDLVLLSLPTREGSGAGRICVDPAGNARAILEMADVRQRRCRRLFREAAAGGEVAVETLHQIALERFSPKPEKCAKAFPELWDRTGTLSAGEAQTLYPEESLHFRLGELVLTPEEAESLPASNTSVYITKRKHLQYVLDHLDRNNAQQEEYLSDIVRLLSQRQEGAKIRCFVEQDQRKVLGFNDPKELLEVSEIIRLRTRRTLPTPDPEIFLPVEEYLRQVQSILAGEKDLPLFRNLVDLYGEDPAIIAGHLQQYLPLLELAANSLAPGEPVAIVRSPGRVNVMGRHVDHQGGNCNLMTINFETLLVVHPRNDDQFTLRHWNEAEFQPCSFTMAGLLDELPWDDWLSVVNSKKLQQLIGQYGVDWSHYIKAAVLRLQKKFHSTPLFGMDLFVAGNVPMAAGLSSSSSLLVGAADAVVCVNQLNTFPAQLVSLCGEGEWFVGTRGGAADHAAVKLGARNKVVKVKFFDFAVEEEVDFPENHVMVICDSGVKARKSGNAKDQFNHRVSCYKLGFRLIRKLYPQYAPLLKHLRDVNCDNLGVRPARIYEILLSLPENATRKELESLLQEDLSEFWSTHNEPADGKYPIRSVILYGLAECARSKAYAELLKKDDLKAIGALMQASHDGDRVTRTAPDGSAIPWHYPCDNRAIMHLIEQLNSGIVEQVAAAQLHNIPGAYLCSIPEIDRMVDIANSVPGVVGAQLAGAGLGGCMMILVHTDAVQALKTALTEQYYIPTGHQPAIFVTNPIAGAGTVPVR
ncbi:MAG: NTP transferase domain-containing protein [Lentisphaeria bacterium]|nr:NTP transferase domain-containing protein [Lentisphaeria bacterium]